MAKEKPVFFDEIQKVSSRRWDQLEADPELAAPWHQLFTQVQSPRHVLSELLQNADDAEATEVAVELSDEYFIFTHNGADFTKENLESICKFGYSNKRKMHTIGFRGIGFKSTFSLGDTVELRTPSLSISFHKSRFTQPVWVEDDKDYLNTAIKVKLKDPQRKNEIENNIEEWISSPFSLLFFNNIQKLRLGSVELEWKNKGSGPVQGSEFMQLEGNNKNYLLCRSSYESFPDEALQEIHSERRLSPDEKMDFPPCRVEVVLGAPGSLFVVLPTGVKTNLPFSINAPFIQDPARQKIKDPETSFTNRWLLSRAGALISNIILDWLSQASLSIEDRSDAYNLLPNFTDKTQSLEGYCERTVEDIVRTYITNEPFLLLENGLLERQSKVISVPLVFWNIWDGSQILEVLKNTYPEKKILANSISEKNQRKLNAINAIYRLSQTEIESIFQNKDLPLPHSQSALLELWYFISQWKYFWNYSSLHIFPVNGQNTLFAGSNIVKLDDKSLLELSNDWEFLSKHLSILDVNWEVFLSEQSKAVEGKDKDLLNKALSSRHLLLHANIKGTEHIDVLIARVASILFDMEGVSLEDGVHLAQIAAKLNAKIGPEFKFWTIDGNLSSQKENVLFFKEGLEEIFLPQELESNLLHSAYTDNYVSCSKDEWQAWIFSSKSWTHSFPPVTSDFIFFNERKAFEKEMVRRGYHGDIQYPFKKSKLIIYDNDFSKNYWDFWRGKAEADPEYWGKLLKELVEHDKSWTDTTHNYAYQISTSNSIKEVGDNPILSSWVLKFRDLPCLPDTQGRYRRPNELMCRTEETEAYIGIEPFVHSKFDTPELRVLLVGLGVQIVPTGPRQLMDRLRALSKVAKPPLMELASLYERIDKLFNYCDTENQNYIRRSFREEQLLFTENKIWQNSINVFLTADEVDAPGAELIHSDVSYFSLWRKIDVREHPTFELALEWLKGLPKNIKLSGVEVRRIKALTGKDPERIWIECGCWLNIASEWVATDTLKYSLSMQSMVSWGRLHDWVKSVTADFQALNADTIQNHPFSTLPPLNSQIEKRLEKLVDQIEVIKLDWLTQLGKLIARIELLDNNLTIRVHEQATRLAKTTFIKVDSINTVPYLEGKPAGLSENELIAWIDDQLYLTPMSNARLAKILSERVADVFGWNDLKATLAYCFMRRETEIIAYIEDNFTLSPETNLDGDEFTPLEEPVKRSIQSEVDTPFPEPDMVAVLETNTNLSDFQEEQKDAQKPVRESRTRSGSGSGAELPALIDRFAMMHGFEKNDKHRYIHLDGRILIKSEGVFHWELITPTNAQNLRFWVKEHCLEAKPLEVPTEIWNRLEQSPQEHVLLLESRNKEPVLFSGAELLAMNKEGRLSLHSATYRIVLKPIDQ